jgi:hypothetical protein
MLSHKYDLSHKHQTQVWPYEKTWPIQIMNWLQIATFKQYVTYVCSQLGYNIMKGTECFVLLQTSVVITEEYNIMVNSDKLICTTEHLTV